MGDLVMIAVKYFKECVYNAIAGKFITDDFEGR